PNDLDSGFLNVQGMGLSEHYELLLDIPSGTTNGSNNFSDYLYMASSGKDGLTNGLWGLMRAYDEMVDQLVPLPNNPMTSPLPKIDYQVPAGVTPRTFNIVATTVKQALPGGQLIYNSRGQNTGSGFNSTQLADPNALIYVRAEDLDKNGQ